MDKMNAVLLILLIGILYGKIKEFLKLGGFENSLALSLFKIIMYGFLLIFAFYYRDLIFKERNLNKKERVIDQTKTLKDYSTLFDENKQNLQPFKTISKARFNRSKERNISI